MWIGLTGGIASGKSQVCEILRTKGYPVIDADEISRNLSKKDAPAYNQIVADFGKEILDSKLDIDRAQLGQIVFSNREKLTQLEKILHPLVRKEVELQKQNWIDRGYSIIFYDVPLLFEKNMQRDFDCIVVVTTSIQNQIERLCRRNQLAESDAKLRIAAQIPLEDKVKSADWVIENNGSLTELQEQVDKCLTFLKGKRI